MEKAKTGRVYSSEKLSNELNEIDPLEMEKVRVRMHLAAKIGEIISEKGFSTQRGFAKHIKKNPSEINKWLSGVHNFTIDTLVEIKWGLEVSMYDFFNKENNRAVVSYQNVTNSEQAIAPYFGWSSKYFVDTIAGRPNETYMQNLHISQASTLSTYQNSGANN